MPQWDGPITDTSFFNKTAKSKIEWACRGSASGTRGMIGE
jgi:hypothetical protein